MKRLIVLFCLAISGMSAFSQTADDIDKLTSKLENIRSALSIIDLQILSVDPQATEYDFKWDSTKLQIQIGKINSVSNLDPNVPKKVKDRQIVYVKYLKRFLAYGNLFNKSQDRNHIQLATFQSQITFILAATDDFEVFLNDLKPKTTDETLLNLIKQVDTNVKNIQSQTNDIQTRVKIIDSYVNEVSSDVKANGDEIKRTHTDVEKARSEIAAVDGTAKQILKLVTPLTTPSGIVGVEAFNNDAYGAFCYFTVGKVSDGESRHFGLEVIVPIQSTAIKGGGGFVSYGIRENHLLLSVGLGYLYNSKPQNISWKIDAMWFIKSEGIGICYSPITNVGVKVAIRLP